MVYQAVRMIDKKKLDIIREEDRKRGSEGPGLAVPLWEIGEELIMFQ